MLLNMMKCAVLSFILIGVWNGVHVVQGETFEYECDILQRFESLEKKIANLENKVKTSDEVIADLESKDRKKDQLLASLETKVNASDKVNVEQAQLIIGLTTKLATLEGRLSGQRVVFHVQNVPVQPVANSTIKFTHMVENTGGVYNLTTGLFTTPAEGTYWFIAQFCSDSDTGFSPSIFINDKLLARTKIFDYNDVECAPVFVVTTLTEGDTVSVKSGPHQGSHPLLITEGDWLHLNAFMGVRLL